MKSEGLAIKGLLWAEWAVLAYVLFTLLLMFLHWQQFEQPMPMLGGRVAVVVVTLLLWRVYRRWPSRWTVFLRVAFQMSLLSWWYPDTYELNRFLPNLDHHFAALEQALFGCQPALLFSQQWPQPLVSELLSLGYVSYYPLIALVTLYYFFRRYDRFLYAVFIIMASFFLFYVIFDLLPVVGPQFYYEAVGTDLIAQGQFPDLGLYFFDHQECLDIPGWGDGPFHHLVQQAHDAGERPTAAFPSSHVGITTVLLWLARDTRCRWLFWTVAVFGLLMFFATFYIYAHYAIDALAGLVVGTLFYYILRAVPAVSR